MEKLKINYPVIVEGKYDRLRLSSMLDAQIITTDGFGIFKKTEKAALLRALAQKSRIIVLTDSDGAGKVIRSHISGLIPPDSLIQLYTPRIHGKEKRKPEPSAEGVLGVEGMDKDLLLKLFEPYADRNGISSDTAIIENRLSKTDFYIEGLSGAENSVQKRDELAARFALPPGMTANALLAALRVICTYEEYLAAVGRKQG